VGVEADPDIATNGLRIGGDFVENSCRSRQLILGGELGLDRGRIMTQRNAGWMRPIAEIQASLCLLVILGFVPAVLIACGPIHFNSGRDVAPSGDPARVWIPPVSVASANETTSRLEELRALNLVPGQPSPAGNEYDLPMLVDVALRSNPQTRRAWYEARAAAAQ
jgi:hypothetical protein